MVPSAPTSLLLIPRGLRNSLLVGEERRPRGCPRPHRHRLRSKQRSESSGVTEMCLFFPLRLISMGTDGGYSRLKGHTMQHGNGHGSAAVLSPLTSCVSSTHGLSWGDQDGQRCVDPGVERGVGTLVITMFHQFYFLCPFNCLLPPYEILPSSGSILRVPSARIRGLQSGEVACLRWTASYTDGLKTGMTRAPGDPDCISSVLIPCQMSSTGRVISQACSSMVPP